MLRADRLKSNLFFINISTRVFILVTIPLAIILMPKSIIFDGSTICLFKNIFGINCLGCGMTRAIFLVFEGNIITACQLNLRVLVVFPILVALWTELIYKQINSFRLDYTYPKL